MPIEDVKYSTLDKIIKKIRKITSSNSQTQITDDDIKTYINDFVLYGYPPDLSIPEFKTTLTFYTSPNVGTYKTNTTNEYDPLYNFTNRYEFTGRPAFVDGIESGFFQDREAFFGLYPSIKKSSFLTKGDGVLGNWFGTLNAIPVIKGETVFTSVDANGNGLAVWDDEDGNLISTDHGVCGTLNSVTGAYDFFFPGIPALGADINVKSVWYTASTPISILFFENKFTLRPIPDDVYAINLEVYKRPTEFEYINQMPELAAQWEYIAFGAAKKIFIDRRDYESLAEIQPLFDEQEGHLVTRNTMNMSDMRVATPYNSGGIGPSRTGDLPLPFLRRY